ncbi:hypothetical protein JW926_18805 [Candidatus Sumerlaeota bacterium]|nr:hypothetical protein [Candidatus Sumerlaeota bacterium]
MPQLIIIAGASGAGKSFLLQCMRRLERNLQPIKKLTTRKPRPYEDEETRRELDLIFEREIEEVTSCDYVYQYAGNWYGSRKSDIDRVLVEGRNPIQIVRSCDTIRKMKTDYPNSLILYLQSGLSGEDLRKKLEEQEREDVDIDERMRRVRNDFFDYCRNIDLFDRVLINYYDPESLIDQMSSVLRFTLERECIEKDLVFVLMPFKPEYSDIFKAIKAAGKLLNGRKLKVEKIDLVHGDYNIVGMIFQYIKRAALIVCDVTEPNTNVFFELGYARALDKRVIPCALEGTKLPFDISHMRHIFYTTPIDLQEKLTNEFRSYFSDVKNHGG